MRLHQDRIRESEFTDHDLTLVIPAYNEAARLPKTLADAKSYLDQWGINYRVLVVDDGSKDQTAQLTEGWGRRFSTISQPNGGKGSAIRRGMMAATGRIVAFTDADLPYDLAALKQACSLLDSQKHDVVFGSRTVAGATSNVDRRFARQMASTIFRSMMTILVSRQITDTQCGLKAFSQSAAKQIFSRTRINGFAFDAEVVYLTHLLNLNFATIPVTLVNEYSTTISLTRNALPMLMDVVGVRWRSMRGEYSMPTTIAVQETPADSIRKAA